MFIVTPTVLFLNIWIDFKRIQDFRDEGYLERFGDFFKEFKRDQRLVQLMYYPVLTTRSLVFVVGQLYVEQEFVQKSLNFAICCLLLAGIIIFKPFKEKLILIANIISEIFICLIFFVILTKNWLIFFKDSAIFDFCFISLVSFQIVFNYLISLIILFQKIRELIRKVKHHIYTSS